MSLTGQVCRKKLLRPKKSNQRVPSSNMSKLEYSLHKNYHSTKLNSVNKLWGQSGQIHV